MRSYSRNSGDTSCEHVTSSPRAASSLATSCSWAASRSACSRHTATASTPSGTAGMLEGSSGSISRPCPSSRPPTSTRRSRSTSGRGRSAIGSYSDGRTWRAISMTSAKPCVVTSATRPPLPSSKALVATVVPWASSSADAPAPASSSAARSACVGSSGVDGTLTTRPSSATRSVNVPPVSTPSPHATTSVARGRPGQRRRSRRPRRPVRTPPVTASITARFAGSPSFRPFRSVTSKRSAAWPSTVRTRAECTSTPALANADRDRVEQAGTVDAADLAQRVPGRCVVVEDDFGARSRRRLERLGRTPRRSPPSARRRPAASASWAAHGTTRARRRRPTWRRPRPARSARRPRAHPTRSPAIRGGRATPPRPATRCRPSSGDTATRARPGDGSGSSRAA